MALLYTGYSLHSSLHDNINMFIVKRTTQTKTVFLVSLPCFCGIFPHDRGHIKRNFSLKVYF